MNPELVIFDCDGVLADSEMISSEALAEELGRLGLQTSPRDVRRRFLGRSLPEVARLVLDEDGVAPPDGFEARYLARLFARFERDLRATPGVETVLTRLRARKCVATGSSPARVERTLGILGLDRFFGENVFTASEVARGKPAPDLFLHAARRMGVDPGRVLVIEDSAPGVAAARAARMGVMRYTGGSHCAGAPTPGVPSFDSWARFPRRLLETEIAEDR